MQVSWGGLGAQVPSAWQAKVVASASEAPSSQVARALLPSCVSGRCPKARLVRGHPGPFAQSEFAKGKRERLSERLRQSVGRLGVGDQAPEDVQE